MSPDVTRCPPGCAVTLVRPTGLTGGLLAAQRDQAIAVLVTKVDSPACRWQVLVLLLVRELVRAHAFQPRHGDQLVCSRSFEGRVGGAGAFLA